MVLVGFHLSGCRYYEHHNIYSVYENLFETSDIMSDVLGLCIRHFHILPDIIMFVILLSLLSIHQQSCILLIVRHAVCLQAQRNIRYIILFGNLLIKNEMF